MSRRVIPGLESPDPVLEADIRRRLGDVEASLEKAVRAESELLGQTASYLLAAGGKRFRPMLVLLAGYFGDPTDPRLVPGAVAIELVHAATLYHDDVIDEAESRHGVVSANARWDNTVAILTGDYLFARASEISTELGTDVCALLARTIATLCDGQIREVEASGRVEQTQASYLEIIRRKTGALIATSCRLGGMLSDAPPWSLDVLEEFGEALGLAFQLSDDIMDVAASEDELGKEPGVDLKEGVYTLPVLHALHGGERSDELRTLLSDGVPEGERLQRDRPVARNPRPRPRRRVGRGGARARPGRAAPGRSGPASAAHARRVPGRSVRRGDRDGHLRRDRPVPPEADGPGRRPGRPRLIESRGLRNRSQA
jgi:heptaprenyl diphosphate synthase